MNYDKQDAPKVNTLSDVATIPFGTIVFLTEYATFGRIMSEGLDDDGNYSVRVLNSLVDMKLSTMDFYVVSSDAAALINAAAKCTDLDVLQFCLERATFVLLEQHKKREDVSASGFFVEAEARGVVSEPVPMTYRVAFDQWGSDSSPKCGRLEDAYNTCLRRYHENKRNERKALPRR